MLEIIEGRYISEVDKDFVRTKEISSWTLMENAATAFCDWFLSAFAQNGQQIVVFCGKGNNGGDGLAIARNLFKVNSSVSVVLLSSVEEGTKDFQANYQLLPKQVKIFSASNFDFDLNSQDIIIDCILGVGITGSIKGEYLEVVRKINSMEAIRIAVDLPSGLPSEAVLEGEAVKAHYTCSFQFPKLSLLLPEHAEYTGILHVADIGIPEEILKPYSTGRYFLRKHDIIPLHRIFNRFSHKGDYGRVLIVGGSSGKIGAVILAAKAAMRSGSGLVHCLVPEAGKLALQVTAPEVMVTNADETEDLGIFDAIGVGPGWGTEHRPEIFERYLNAQIKPLVIDADGLNMLSQYPELMKFIPQNSILTPHLKEFERLAGKCSNHVERLERAKEFAQQYHVILVLKGANTCIISPSGEQYFNSTGNQYMATAGSGDVLTGMVVSFLGQGYSPLNAALCAVFHHGLAGELASINKLRGLIAPDIIDAIPLTYVELGIK